MWKKPSIQKPDFNKLNLNEISEKESLETNGGIASTVSPISIIKIYPPLSGIIAPPLDLKDILIKK